MHDVEKTGVQFWTGMDDQFFAIIPFPFCQK
jgi:hypothetical protein